MMNVENLPKQIATECSTGFDIDEEDFSHCTTGSTKIKYPHMPFQTEECNFLQLLVEWLGSHGNLRGSIAMTQTFSATWKVTIPYGGSTLLLSQMMPCWMTFSATFLCGIETRCLTVFFMKYTSFKISPCTYEITNFSFALETRDKVPWSDSFLP